MASRRSSMASRRQEQEDGWGRQLSQSPQAIHGGLNRQEQFPHELMRKLFKENKVEIASAITNLFPFLMGLRDRAFISEQAFERYEEMYRNLVPVERVMYGVVSELETKFDHLVLEAVFSEVNLKNYRGLNKIHSIFQDALRNNVSHQINDGEDIQERSNIRPSCRQGTCAHRAPQMTDEVEQMEMSRRLPSEGEERSNECLEVCDEEEAQEVGLSPQRPQAERSDECLEVCDEEAQEVGLSPQRAGAVTSDSNPPQKRNRVEPEQVSRTRPSRGEERSDECLEVCDEGEAQEVGLSPQRAGAAELPAPDVEKCSCVVCFTESVPGAEEERTESSQAPVTVDTGNKSTLGKRTRKRKKKKGHSWSRKKRNVYQKGLRKHRKKRDEIVNVHSSSLPVTCGEVKGILYKKKLERGASVKCVQSEAGEWFTAREFEITGGRARWKNWKLSIRCAGWPLQWLMELENSDTCEVCQTKEDLFCCDTCLNSFHKDCHIPPVDPERNPWSCIICMIEVSSVSQQCHQESEILERLMLPEEQLKCEFLLLKVYCNLESSFINILHDYNNQGDSQRIKEQIQKIKKRLSEKVYQRVEGFVRDMCLFFKKNNDFDQMGLTMEAEFEKNFKEVFAIQETNENNSLG
ncbi:nuclear body protein SP140 isoform X3 [Choloepus didactylus]|uniref:nuclear body protein SP140 isoform X3 n=1 Tax=Choloepus didactylus TaxID=27675 RepID=UPI00189E01AD|nr:nuclear body protein SP140 isoform X3 [Choloepus didactylus]